MNSQKEKPLISVVVPTHNRLGLLQEALDTVYAQEGIGELFEMEVIVVDDTPSEATLRAMNRYPGIQYIPLEASVFVSAARNVGIRASRGEYVALLDDDLGRLEGDSASRQARNRSTVASKALRLVLDSPLPAAPSRPAREGSRDPRTDS